MQTLNTRNIEIQGSKIIEYRFGSEFIQYKPLKWLWSNYYKYLYTYLKDGKSGKIKYEDKEIQNDPILKLLFEKFVPQTWFYINNEHMNTQGANKAASEGKLYITKWLAEQNIYADEVGANLAASNNHVQILDYLKNNEIYPTKIGIYEASKLGYIDIIKFYKNNRQRISDVKIESIILFGINHNNLIRYMLSDYVHNPIMSTLLSSTINDTMKSGNLRDLKILLSPEFLIINGIVNTTVDADAMIQFRNFILPYYKVNNPINKAKIDYIVSGINCALERKHIDILEYLANYTIYPSLVLSCRLLKSAYDEKIYNYFNKIGYVKICNYLSKNKISLIPTLFDKLSKDGNMNHIEYLGNYMIYISARPKQQQVNLAYHKGFDNVVQYFESTFGMYPNN